MRLRSITLDNVRRFTDAVTVGPFGDGVTLLCEPNEAGKSTLFDALHALFFVRHGSQAAEVKALRPHSGGKVAVECTLEHDGAEWRLRKEWLSGASASVWRDGALAHQGDAAEDWISTLVSGKVGGPGGLLWVRQGRVTLNEPAKSKDAKQELAARRDLLTAISGAVDQVTGGERMDRAIERVENDLAKLQTTTGRPKTGGRWAEAEAALAALAEEEDALARTVDDLRKDLDQRRKLRTELSDLEDEAAATKRREDLNQAETALRRAERQQEEVNAAEVEARLARQTADTVTAEAERVAALHAEARDAARQHSDALENLRARSAERETAASGQRSAKDALRNARAALAEALATLRLIDKRDAAERAKGERTRLTSQIDKAEAAEAERIAQHALAQKGPDEAAVERIADLARALATQRAVRDAAAPRVTAHYDPGAPALQLAGTPLRDGESRPLPEGGRIELPGIGTLDIAVSGETAGPGLAEAETALRDALARGGWEDLDAVKTAARARADAARAAELAEQRRDTLAADGIEALRTRLAGLPETPPQDAAELPDRESAESALAEAQKHVAATEAGEGKAAELAQAAALTAAKAEERAEAAQARKDKADGGVAALPDTDPDDTAERIAAHVANAEKAEAAHAELAASAPDMDQLRAQHARRKGVVDAATARIATIGTEIGKLDGRIETRGEEGVEERLTEVRERREAAEATLDRVIFERDVLARLREALDIAQKAAREAYFAPVARELRPLLSDLWDDADLIWSDDTLLPQALVRHGTEEAIDVLSGGTQEQIAFLVRLAFARLLARSGQHAPLILDDALVYSDDDRIEKMFNALHGAAGDLQIIVLSCRQRAFRDLGAPAVGFRRRDTA